jgi:capsular exopolysaccharide synthesis family protein
MDPRPDSPVSLPARDRRPRSEESIEVRRYLDALRRAKWPILVLVLLATATAVIVSSLLPKRYSAGASIVKQVASGPYDAVNVDSVTRELQTIQRLLTTSAVLDRAARRLPGETEDSLSGAIESDVDPDANLIYVSATAGTARRAADRANAVATAFVEEQRDVTRQQYERARTGLLQELDRVQDEPGANQQEQALRQRLSELSVVQANAGSDLSIAERAGPPSSATSPKPARNGVIAFFLALFVGVLAALGRDQLVPRVSGPRELSRLLDLPILTTVPYVRRTLGRRRILSGIEHESYQTLGASVRFALPPESGPHVVLVTSALHAEGKSTVTARLGQALANSGNQTLIVSADMRWPTLHQLVDVPAAPGLSELLMVHHEHGDGAEFGEQLHHAIVALETGPRQGELDILPSGRKPPEPAALLASQGLDAAFARLTRLGFDYILVDAPPLLGIADTQSLARCADTLLYVARLDRITLDNLMDARDVLDRTEARPAGLVVIGARTEASPYYVGVRAPALEDA